jgi:uncharacterized membrane protein
MRTADQRPTAQLHPFHAVILAGALPLFLGTLLSDWAYSATYEVQWTNFASWLLAGALLLSGFALLWSFMNMFRRGRRQKRTWLTFLLLLATFTVGFINALVHTKDGWAVVPEGLVLSFIVAVLAAAAVWSGFAGGRLGAIR